MKDDIVKDQRREVSVAMDATGKHPEVTIGVVLSARDLPISSARALAQRILDQCDHAEACLSEMLRRERDGYKGVGRYPASGWKPNQKGKP